MKNKWILSFDGRLLLFSMYLWEIDGVCLCYDLQKMVPFKSITMASLESWWQHKLNHISYALLNHIYQCLFAFDSDGIFGMWFCIDLYCIGCVPDKWSRQCCILMIQVDLESTICAFRLVELAFVCENAY